MLVSIIVVVEGVIDADLKAVGASLKDIRQDSNG